MKEFDLAKAKAGAPICTRDGRPARIICWDAKNKHNPEFQILALIDNDGSDEDPYLYNNDGKWLRLHGDPSLDLMMAPVKHEGWVHVNDEFGVPFIAQGKIYKTKEQANAAPKAERFITVAKIEWEE